ncbi:hypothetical protein HJFPF1_11719 [Paramyrothecium foliicola]|nr:hypothetical protein HJFPF1_11719 [Paramyrothecium foliicola]
MQMLKRLLGCLVAVVLILGWRVEADLASGTITATANISSTSPTITVCPARTINYITHTLPQSCLTTSWTSSRMDTGGPSASRPRGVDVSNPGYTISEQPQPTNTTIHNASEAVDSDALPTTFMSFEDWKEMMLRRSGQDPQDLRSRQSNERRGDQRVPPDSGHTGLGEEDEININFEAFLQGGENTPGESGRHDDAAQHEKEVFDGYKSGHRSKDAGKTCKERFSYSSFDAGATVLKSSPGAKNAKAILAENKDSYMLLECAAAAKYIVVELSDDILVDTVVLANFEFFSSMIRHFRVSLSDRYPVKGDKWQDLGVFEARNSRDIQPFLVENPGYFAKYIRIDFLTHFGNEYYCPVSLLRVHGSRMLDSWREAVHQDEEVPHLIDDFPQERTEDYLPEKTLLPESELQPDPNITGSQGLACQSSAHLQIFLRDEFRTCKPAHQSQITHMSASHASGETHAARSNFTSTEGRTSPGPIATPRADRPTSGESPQVSPTVTSAAIHPPVDNRASQSHNGTSTPVTAVGETGSDPNGSANRVAGSGSSGKTRVVGSSGAAATAAVQENFFNAITKRLQQVESNLTLSLKYVEDQSRYVQEALQRGEQKQLYKVTQFLEALNQTVLADLRHLREQYDQIWQSTVIALESHREQSERDILALGSRLNLLADEVVFQKRMAIVQAVLLLSCLFLVIFSRGVPLPYFTPILDQGNTSLSYRSPTSLPMQPRHDIQAGITIPQRAIDSPCEAQLEGQQLYLSHTIDPSMASEAVDSPGNEHTTHIADEDQDLAHFRPLSPSPSPNPVPELAESLDFKATRQIRSVSVRQSSARKPLPALPEQGESP